MTKKDLREVLHEVAEYFQSVEHFDTKAALAEDEAVIDEATNQLLTLFNDRLTSLMGEVGKLKPSKNTIAKIMTTDYLGDNMARAYNQALKEVTDLIKKELKEK